MSGNPLARRIRLGRALKELREQHGDTHSSLGKRAGTGQSNISRLENPTENLARRTSLLVVRQLLDALGVSRNSEQWCELENLAEAGAGRGWWSTDLYLRMGVRQRTYAIAESDTETIRDYGSALLPGPVQIADYARYRAQVSADGPDVDIDAIVAGRLHRQHRILDSVTRYDLVLEEQTVRRYPVPPPVMLDQLRHLLELISRPNVSIRVLPVDAQVANGCGAVPRSPFTLYSYPDRDDPEIVIADTVTADLLIINADEVEGYVRLHQRLSGAALSDADSAALIREVVDKLAATV